MSVALCVWIFGKHKLEKLKKYCIVTTKLDDDDDDLHCVAVF